MKKIINYSLLFILSVLYFALFVNISLNSLLKKENLTKIIDNIKIEELIEIDDYYETEILENLSKKITKRSVLSIFNYEKPYTEKEILNLIDEEIYTITIDKEKIRNEIYVKCSKINEKIPNSETLSNKEKTIIEGFKTYLSSNKILIICIVMVTLMLVPINLSTFDWLRYSGLLITISSVLYLVLLYGLSYLINTISNEYIYKLIQDIVLNLYNNFLSKIYIFVIIGIIQVIAYVIIFSLKYKNSFDENNFN